MKILKIIILLLTSFQLFAQPSNLPKVTYKACLNCYNVNTAAHPDCPQTQTADEDDNKTYLYDIRCRKCSQERLQQHNKQLLC